MNQLSFKTHISLFLMSFITWAFFVIVGLPDYYQSWSFNNKFIICALVTVVYFPLGTYLIKKMFLDKEYFKNSLWLALYLTVPLLIFDIIYIIGFLGEQDMSFITKYWYLTFFYFSFWVQFPLVGLLMEKNLSEKTN